MFKYEVRIDRSCVKDWNDGEKWGSWESEYNNKFHSITRVEDGEYGEIQSSLDLKRGDKCWVVWVEYSSGDSFGQGVRNDVTPVAVFTFEEAAEELK